MNKTTLMLAAATVVLGLGGCNSASAPAGDQTASEAATEPATDASASSSAGAQAMVGEGEGGSSTNCPMASSEGWAATLSAVTTPKAGHALTVTGTVTVNTGGYKVSLAPGATLEMQPPIQQMVLTVTPPSPTTNVIQMVTHLPVKAVVADAYPAYGAVQVLCGGQRIANITKIGKGE